MCAKETVHNDQGAPGPPCRFGEQRDIWICSVAERPLRVPMGFACLVLLFIFIVFIVFQCSHVIFYQKISPDLHIHINM